MSHCVKKCEEFNNLPSEKPENTIFHYTNYLGLKGIIESRCLWMTDYKHLNDRSEISYACEKMMEIIGEQLITMEDLYWWESFINIFPNIIKNGLNFYVLSFCLKGNYLSAWRWYANDGCGFSIGFRQTLINRGYSTRLTSAYKIHYNPETYQDLIKTLFSLATEEIKKSKKRSYYGHSQNCFMKKLLSALASNLIEILPRIKHEAYAEEKEYCICEVEWKDNETNKLCNIHIPQNKKFWRGSRNTTSPFVSTIPALISEQFDSEYIAEIWVGPGLNFEHAKHEILELLYKHKYKNPEKMIKQSTIPYQPR